MRLIDADEFKKQIAGMAIANNYTAEKANKMCELIDCQPTAYDVDKVLECMEERIENFKTLNSDDEIVDVAVKEIQRDIEALKSGGIVPF